MEVHIVHLLPQIVGFEFDPVHYEKQKSDS